MQRRGDMIMSQLGAACCMTAHHGGCAGANARGLRLQVGFTQLQRWLCFSAVKNNLDDAAAKAKAGFPPLPPWSFPTAVRLPSLFACSPSLLPLPRLRQRLGCVSNGGVGHKFWAQCGRRQDAAVGGARYGDSMRRRMVTVSNATWACA